MKSRTKVISMRSVKSEITAKAIEYARFHERKGMEPDVVTVAQCAIESLNLSDSDMIDLYFDSLDLDGMPIHDGGVYEYLLETFIDVYISHDNTVLQ